LVPGVVARSSPTEANPAQRSPPIAKPGYLITKGIYQLGHRKAITAGRSTSVSESSVDIQPEHTAEIEAHGILKNEETGQHQQPRRGKKVSAQEDDFHPEEMIENSPTFQRRVDV
jgi:hypothetical protein